jgi:hypothetical protein
MSSIRRRSRSSTSSGSASTRSTSVPSWDLKTLWVANNAENTTKGSLTPIDPKTGKPGKPIAVDDPYNMYFTPDGKEAIVVAEAYKRLDFRDPQTMALKSSIATPDCKGINHADFSIDGRFAIFTCEFRPASWSRSTWSDRKVLGYLKLSTGKMPQDIRVSPDGSTFYVADMMADGVFVVDGASFKETGFIKTGKGTHGLYPSRDGKQALRRQPRLEQDPRRRQGHGQRLGARLRDPQGRRAPGRSRRRQPRHGQRQRRRQAAVAVGPLRQRRLRVRHDERRGQDHPVGKEPHGLTVWPQPGRYSLGHTGNMR